MELREVVEDLLYPDTKNPFTGEPLVPQHKSQESRLNLDNLAELRDCIEDLQDLQWSNTHGSDPYFLQESLTLVKKIRELYQLDKLIYDTDERFLRYYEECAALFTYLEES